MTSHPLTAWLALALVLSLPILGAAASPLLAWRDGIYIAAGFAGVVAMSLLLVQPLLIGGRLPGLAPRTRLLAHRLTGAALIAAVIAHVAGLWLTSPPDVIDALLFRSPTPFSAFGVVAMWALLATGLLASLRRRLRQTPWRLAHTALAAVIVAGSIIHALLIEGTMEPISKLVLCALVAGASAREIIIRWRALRR